LARQQGDLVPIDESIRMWEAAMERIRTKMIAAINVNAPRIIGIRNIAQAHATLEGIIYDALAAGASVAEEIRGGGLG